MRVVNLKGVLCYNHSSVEEEIECGKFDMFDVFVSFTNNNIKETINMMNCLVTTFFIITSIDVGLSFTLESANFPASGCRKFIDNSNAFQHQLRAAGEFKLAHDDIPNRQHLSPRASMFRLYSSSKSGSKKPQQQRKGYEKVGGDEPIDFDICPLSEDEILNLLKERTKARRARNFQKADDLLSTLKRNNVSVNDSTKQWRADGRVFVDFSTDKDSNQSDDSSSTSSTSSTTMNEEENCLYVKASNSRSLSTRDEEYIINKLKERYVAKSNQDYDSADDIRDELRFLKNVEIDDSKKTFCVVDPFKLEYTFGGKRVNNIKPEVLHEIECKIKERAAAKKNKNYKLADSLLGELTDVHYVRVNDAKKEWHFMKKNLGIEVSRERDGNANRTLMPRNISSSNSSSSSRLMSNNNPKSDWSVFDNADDSNELIPGISFSDEREEIPEGISIGDGDDDDKEEAIPDGILIEGVNEVNDNHVPSGIVIDEEDNDMIPLETLTVPMLKEKLRAAGLPVSGRKMELIDRLVNSA